MVSQEMRDRIVKEIKHIETRENVKVLMAVESGSRMWKFASPDSDYDVRFIYVRQMDEYLKLWPHEEHITVPISDELDLSGWDLKKAMRLLSKSNPGLTEWANSDIVYFAVDGFVEDLRKAIDANIDMQSLSWHYRNIAVRNYHQHLTGKTVRYKKYFYCLRGYFSLEWIYDNGTLPPLDFNELMKFVRPGRLKDAVLHLLDIKRTQPEAAESEPIAVIDEYLQRMAKNSAFYIQDEPAADQHEKMARAEVVWFQLLKKYAKEE